MPRAVHLGALEPGGDGAAGGARAPAVESAAEMHAEMHAAVVAEHAAVVGRGSRHDAATIRMLEPRDGGGTGVALNEAALRMLPATRPGSFRADPAASPSPAVLRDAVPDCVGETFAAAPEAP